MTGIDLIKITGGYFINLTKNTIINKICLDSRKCTKNDVFICVNSGDEYIPDAVKRGASYIITVSDIRFKTRVGIIKVNSIKDTLLRLGSYIRDKYRYIPLVALTGSVGKSTTKALISSILGTQYKVLFNEGNKNNYIGVTETLFNLDDSIDIVVMELGMNHYHEIDEMSLMLRPDICAITNIGTSHIGNLGSQKDILASKLEIVDGMDDGYLVVPSNDKYLSRLKLSNICKCYDIIIKNVVVTDKLKFDLIYNDLKYNVRFKVPNKRYIDNIVVAFKICTFFNIKESDIIKSINAFKALEKRMNIININDYMLIDDCYNSSYESLMGVLEYIRYLNRPKLLILGDILELGVYSKQIHKKINRYLKKIKDKEVLLVGDATKYIDGVHFDSNDDIIKYIAPRDLSGYVILIKGSRMMKLEEVRDYLNVII